MRALHPSSHAASPNLTVYAAADLDKDSVTDPHESLHLVVRDKPSPLADHTFSRMPPSLDRIAFARTADPSGMLMWANTTVQYLREAEEGG